uniref:Glycolipid transfer protein n=1 Tax=Bos indicus x Bos taurus TaxID=30522 RepID=A0A4W2C8W9_BOBOX
TPDSRFSARRSFPRLPRPKVPQAPTIPCRPTATLSDSAALTPAFSPLVAEATGRRWSAARAKPPASRLLGVHREKRSLCFSVVPPRGGRELNRGHRSSKEKNPFTTPNSGWWLPEGGRQVGSQLHPTCTERIPKECRSVAVRQGPGLAWLLELCCFITRAGSLPTAEFLKTGATTSTQRPFWKTDCLGSPVFTPIKADISGNITKIKAVYDTNPTKFRTLQNILEVEKEMYGAEWPKVGATLALMWLKRGLRFIQVFLQSICDGERDENHPNLIRVNATKAYEMALKKYHGWIVQKIFQAALYAAPYKSDFLKALSKGQNVTEEECLEKIRLFLVNYTATIDVIYEMYTRMNAELNYKV